MVSACEQSGRSHLPELLAPIPLATYLNAPSRATRMVCCPEATRPLSTVELTPTELEFVIGPEGGFERHELEQAKAAGLHRVLMGPRILRTETAGPAAIVACQIRWGDM